ncbi:hypothetical protein GCM10010329_81980 [Streptomyces spiroverticillatus]|uniref:Uncharacterized protein n=1 Tax=Streptomyces finlayi TaxID=67296 RepID=A0A918X8V5_9ACTN|nr:hypothetical protein GCM10010329_81980 [Streptomyces spiroverticillatus]GHD18315.1 hypothetical protein GCM10010334_81060 [Streptomyces finlayi]
MGGRNALSWDYSYQGNAVDIALWIFVGWCRAEKADGVGGLLGGVHGAGPLGVPAWEAAHLALYLSDYGAQTAGWVDLLEYFGRQGEAVTGGGAQGGKSPGGGERCVGSPAGRR